MGHPWASPRWSFNDFYGFLISNGTSYEHPMKMDDLHIDDLEVHPF